MTKELAIRILTGDVLGTTEQTKEAVTMAVRALSQQNVTDTNVGDIISRQAAIDAFYKYPNIDWTTLDVLKKINALPSAQPVRHGKWIPYKAYLGKNKDSWVDEVRCSKCGYAFGEPEWKYCPECGARMDEEREVE